MGILDGLLGGAVGAEVAVLVNGFVEKQGGVQGIVAQFEKQGMGDTVKSWIANGTNQPITAEHIQQVFGSDTIQQIAGKLGIPADLVAAKLAELLPQSVDKMTPEGKIAA